MVMNRLPVYGLGAVLPTLLLLLFHATPSPAQSAEERSFLRDALADGEKENYRRSAADLKDYLETWPGDGRALQGLLFTQRMQGRYEEALATARAWVEAGGGASALVEKGRLLVLLGRFEEGEAVFRAARKAAPDSLETAAALAVFLYERGRREEATDLAREALSHAQGADLDGKDLCRLGTLYRMLGDLERAAEAGVYADAALNGRMGRRYHPTHVEPLLLLGDVYRRTRMGSGSGRRAVACFLDALAVNPRHPDVLLGLARTRFYAFRFHEARLRVEQALDVNPVHAEALAFYAHLLLIQGEYRKAAERVARGLAMNPRHRGLLAASAAIRLFQGDRKGCDALLAKALKSDPCFGVAWYRLAELLAYHYRFSEAEQAARRCLEIDPRYHETYVLLGRILANLGREKEAREALIESARRDPYPYPWRENMLAVLDTLRTYRRVRSDLFTLVLAPEESGVMRTYLQRLGRESFRLLAERYGLEVETPLLLEVFPRRDDFDVRTVGFTGLGALGACFGRVVTLFCPDSGPYQGRFSWSATLHHELAHAFTLPLSRYRIPRWFTEGISVYEEEQRHRWWRRNMDMELYNALHNERLFRLERFDAGFSGPRILLAYAQAGRMVKFMKERYGMEKLRALVRAYGEDLDTSAVFRKVLDLAPARVDEAFRSWLAGGLFAGVKCRPAYDRKKQLELMREAREDPEDGDKQIRAAWACFHNGKRADARYFLGRAEAVRPDYGPCLLLRGDLALGEGDGERAEALYRKAAAAGSEDFHVYMKLGLMASGRGDRKGMVSFLEKAAACFPTYIGPDGPLRMLLEVHTEEGDEDAAARDMETLLDAGAQDVKLMKRLGQYYESKNDFERARDCFRAAVDMDPFRRDLHFHLGKALGKLEEYPRALEELDFALKTGGHGEQGAGERHIPLGKRGEIVSDADVHAERAALLMAMGEEDEAEREAEIALSSMPDHARAREVLNLLHGHNNSSKAKIQKDDPKSGKDG